MYDTQNTVNLASIRAEMADGLINITDHMTRLDQLIARGGEDCAERRELWRMETLQAGLGRQQSQLMDRMAPAAPPPVVLVVEDDILVLVSTVADLESAGYIVYDAASADEALRLLEIHDEIRAVFTDVQMPGTVNGLELARLVHSRWPAVKVLVTSGNDLFGAHDLRRGDQFVRKPYLTADIVTALRCN